MKVDIMSKYKSITNLQRCIDGKIYIRLNFNGMPKFKMTYDFKDFVFNNEEDADKYLSENMHKIEIDLYKAELKQCYKHIKNQTSQLFYLNEKIKKVVHAKS